MRDAPFLFFVGTVAKPRSSWSPEALFSEVHEFSTHSHQEMFESWRVHTRLPNNYEAVEDRRAAFFEAVSEAVAAFEESRNFSSGLSATMAWVSKAVAAFEESRRDCSVGQASRLSQTENQLLGRRDARPTTRRTDVPRMLLDSLRSAGRRLERMPLDELVEFHLPSWALSKNKLLHCEPRTERYLGNAKTVKGADVIAELHLDSGDVFEARIPLAAFDSPPSADDEIECAVTTVGASLTYRARTLPKGRVPTLKDLGIDRDELLEWASELDI